MVKIQRLESGSYRARVHLGNGKYKSITGKDKKQVQFEAAKIEADVTKAKEPENPYRSITLGEAMAKYIELKSAVLSPATIRGYDAIMRNRAKDLQRIKISDITQEDIQRAINEDAMSHKPKGVRNLHCFISAVLDVYRHDLHLDTTLPKRSKTKVAIPTQEEIDKLTAYFRGTEMELPFALAVCCGLRESEISGLRWEDVDFESGRIFIRQAKVRDKTNAYVEKGTKSDAGDRTIRLYPFIFDIIKKTERAGEHVTQLRNNVMYSRFVSALDHLGLPHYRFHDLRHYLVSVMLSLNIPKNYIADYVGHADESMIDRVYGHIMSAKKTSVEDLMDEFFRKSDTKSDTNPNESL